jgi:hypothetical protein
VLVLVVVELFSAVVVAGAVAWAAVRIAHAVGESRAADQRTRSLELMMLFAPGIAAAADDPKAILTWQSMAVTARALFPAEFTSLDQASGGRFPFDVAIVEAAHARWSTDWLAWERTHDAEYKLRAQEIEDQGRMSANPALTRSRLEAVERERLDTYQQRYTEYVRVSKALHALKP